MLQKLDTSKVTIPIFTYTNGENVIVPVLVHSAATLHLFDWYCLVEISILCTSYNQLCFMVSEKKKYYNEDNLIMYMTDKL
jgi:hypothetical protein